MSAIEEDLVRIEEGTFKLQKDWERFFSGQERKAPFEGKQRLERLIRSYLGTEIRNNIERFRFLSLTARYNTLSDMWNRRLRAIEEGRPLPSQVKHARGAEGAAAAADGAAAGSGSRVHRSEIRLSTMREDDEGVRDLYDEFMRARASVGEPELRFDSFRQLIAQQRIRFLEEKDAVAVDFRIALQHGKVALKAKPVRTG